MLLTALPTLATLVRDITNDLFYLSRDKLKYKDKPKSLHLTRIVFFKPGCINDLDISRNESISFLAFLKTILRRISSHYPGSNERCCFRIICDTDS